MICEGPKSNTLVDHWLMIWQEEVSLIIMLTNLTEGGKVLFTERLFIFLNFKIQSTKQTGLLGVEEVLLHVTMTSR